MIIYGFHKPGIAFLWSNTLEFKLKLFQSTVIGISKCLPPNKLIIASWIRLKQHKILNDFFSCISKGILFVIQSSRRPILMANSNFIHRRGGYYAFGLSTPPPQCGERFHCYRLQPTVFYLELLYLQVMFSLRKSCLGIFLASFWKTRWPLEQFFDFFLYFFLILLFWLCYRHSFQLFRSN